MNISKNMSVIAVKKEKDKIIIGADSQITHYMYLLSNTTKQGSKLVHYKEDNLVIGSVGTAKVSSLLPLFLETNKLKDDSEVELVRFFKKFENWLDTETSTTGLLQQSSQIVVKNTRVFLFSNYYIGEITDYWAIGIPELAIAALALGSSVEEALKITCKHTIDCSEPLQIIEIPIKI